MINKERETGLAACLQSVSLLLRARQRAGEGQSANCVSEPTQFYSMAAFGLQVRVWVCVQENVSVPGKRVVEGNESVASQKRLKETD